MVWFPVHAINLNLLQVKGRSDLFLKLEIYKKIIGLAILVATVPMGLVAMCYGAILNSILALIINTYYTGKLIDVGFVRQIRDLAPTILYSLSMFLIVLGVVHLVHGNIAKLLSGIAIGLVYFFIVTTMTKSTDLKELLGLIKRK